jgi:hypothetical protein
MTEQNARQSEFLMAGVNRTYGCLLVWVGPQISKILQQLNKRLCFPPSPFDLTAHSIPALTEKSTLFSLLQTETSHHVPYKRRKKKKILQHVPWMTQQQQ